MTVQDWANLAGGVVGIAIGVVIIMLWARYLEWRDRRR